MFKSFIIPLLLLSPEILKAQDSEINRFLILNESNLRINGTSSLTDFSCNSEHKLEADTLNTNIRFREKIIEVSESKLILKIDEFDCGKKGINRDFRQTLKYREHPNIVITLNSLNIDTSKRIPETALVTIKIAGISQIYEVPLSNISVTDEITKVSGQKLFLISDFGLKAPSPMLGLIKVSNEIQIEFDLVIMKLKG